MKKVVSFGELMLRLAPPLYDRFVQCGQFQATYGGGEANVAVSLANFGLNAAFVTKLPKHEIGQAAINSLRRFGVDTTNIARGGERLGIYFLEKGANQRPSKVVYDRANSAISTATLDDFDWEAILAGADWFHFTGITPALSRGTAEIAKAAAKKAKDLGLTVSCDLNYRKNLWSKEEAGVTMSALMPYVDLCIANEEDAADVFGISSSGSDVAKGKLNHAGYIDVAKQLTARFNFKHVAITLRESVSANHNNWSGMLYNGREAFFSKRYEIRNIVDRVGGGDSFGAGLIYGMLSNKTEAQSLEFAVAASCLKHSIEGDCNMTTPPEVEALAQGSASGRVQR